MRRRFKKSCHPNRLFRFATEIDHVRQGGGFGGREERGSGRDKLIGFVDFRRDGGAECGQYWRLPGNVAAEVIPDGGESGANGVVLGAGDPVSTHAALGFHIADRRFEGGAAHSAFDLPGDAPLGARIEDLELVLVRGVVEQDNFSDS